jgi:hypothetical protein
LVKVSEMAQAGKNNKNGVKSDGHKLFNAIDLNNDNSLQLSELTAVLGATTAKHFSDAMSHVSKNGEVGRADFVNWASGGGEKFAKLNKELENINESSRKGTVAMISSAANKIQKKRIAKEKAAAAKAAAAKVKAENEKKATAEKERAAAAAAAAGKGKSKKKDKKKGKKETTPAAGSLI